MKYPDIEKRVRKLERQAAIRDCAVHVVFVGVGENRDEKVAALGSIPPGDNLIVVNFVEAADIQGPATRQ